MKPAQNTLLAANLICMASMLVWAAGLPAADVIIKLLPQDSITSSLMFTASRMAMAAAVLLPVWLLVEGWGALRDAQWLRGIWVGALIGIGALCVVIGQAKTDPVTVAIISATMPLVGTALEVGLDGKRFTLQLGFGLLLSMLGAIVALGSGINGLNIGIGAAICFFSVLTFTLGSRLTVTAFPNRSALARTTLTLAGASIATAIASGVAIGAGGITPDQGLFGWWELGALAIFAIGGLAISQMLWIVAVGKLGVGLAALHINATPFYVMLILFALGGAWNWMQAFGALLVAIGVIIAQEWKMPMKKRAV
jgi:drug/metabolite transporter (DMT)-like permease